MKIFKKRRHSRFEANWNRITTNRRSGQLIQRINIDSRSGILVERIDWCNYWEDVFESACGNEITLMLELLQKARSAYLLNPINDNYAKEYCCSYFKLLHKAVHSKNESYSTQLIRALIGLETIPIHWGDSTRPDLVAINTKTNPVYLLSRIQQPKSWDNPRFLPVVSYNCSHLSVDQPVSIYHHYRRISGGMSEPTTLFTYIPATIADRKNSFIAWRHFAALLTPKKDSLIKTRSRCLSEHVLRPIIAQIPGWKQSADKMLRIADIGGGSGDLTKEIFENLLASKSGELDSLRVSWVIVDHSFPDMTRHLKRTRFFQSLLSLKCQRKDFLDWTWERTSPSSKPEIEVPARISEQQKSKPFDFIFMFRLLDTMSESKIGQIATWEDVHAISCGKLTESDWQQGKHYPHKAILNGQVEKLVLSTKQVALKSHNTYCIGSLTDYFHAMFLLSGVEEHPALSEADSKKTIFFPFTKLDLERIQYPKGRNLFADLCRLAHFVLIEDLDLQPNDLRQHLAQNGLSHISVIALQSKIPSSKTMCVFERPFV